MLASLAIIAAAPVIGATDRGEWVVGLDQNHYCTITKVFQQPGGVNVVLVVNDEGAAGMFISNRDWSTVKGRHYSLTLTFDGKPHPSRGIGVELEVSRGFMMPFDGPMFTAFRQSRRVKIESGGVLIADLDLYGTSDAFGRLGLCMDNAKQERAGNENALRVRPGVYDPFAAIPSASGR